MLTEIISGLWIGNLNDSYNDIFYKDNLISIAINCTMDQGFLDLPKLQKVRIPLSDKLEPYRDIQLLKNNMDKILNFIHENIEEENIFIFCYNGLTVSPLICALYMIKKGGHCWWLGTINQPRPERPIYPTSGEVHHWNR